MVFNETLLSLTNDTGMEAGDELQISDIMELIDNLNGTSAKLVDEFFSITPEMWGSEDEALVSEYATYQVIMELVGVTTSSELDTKRFLIDLDSETQIDYLNQWIRQPNTN